MFWLALTSALLIALVASVALGTRDVSLNDVVAALHGSDQTISQAAVASRLPRTVLALVIGAALALAGASMQAVTRNPVADPGILGVSAGAGLAVVIGMTVWSASGLVAHSILAVVGGAASAVFVYSVASLGPLGATPLKLALAGAATAAALMSLTSAVLLPRVDVLPAFRMWQVGGVGGATWERVAFVTPLIAVAAFACLVLASGMNALSMGDELAAGLGQKVGQTRALVSLIAVVLTGVATAVAGPIGFVGLVVPHLCRVFVGPDYRRLLPAAAVTGGVLLVIADVVGRVISRPQEIEVGIVMALIGAPFFIWIVRRATVRGW